MNGFKQLFIIGLGAGLIAAGITQCARAIDYWSVAIGIVVLMFIITQKEGK